MRVHSLKEKGPYDMVHIGVVLLGVHFDMVRFAYWNALWSHVVPFTFWSALPFGPHHFQKCTPKWSPQKCYPYL